MVATYCSSDTDPKERFVHQQAGDGGYGDSSYIDLVAFRERDMTNGWTGAPDGGLEERIYYCQNQHADVVALITAAGGQREMDRYSAYGVPFGLPVGDCDSDGDCDTTDRNQVQTWINNSNQYDVRGDLDLDGDADSTDKTNLRDNYEGVTLVWGVLSASAVSNLRGPLGHILGPVGSNVDYASRSRSVFVRLGVWGGRDPLEYIDEPNLYLLLRGNPAVLVDPMGTSCTWGSGTRRGAGNGDPTSPSPVPPVLSGVGPGYCEGWPFDAQFCIDKCNKTPALLGETDCCGGGRLVTCLCPENQKRALGVWGEYDDAVNSLAKATMVHEEAHFNGAYCSVMWPHGPYGPCDEECASNAEVKEWERLLKSGTCKSEKCRAATKLVRKNACEEASASVRKTSPACTDT